MLVQHIIFLEDIAWALIRRLSSMPWHDSGTVDFPFIQLTCFLHEIDENCLGNGRSTCIAWFWMFPGWNDENETSQSMRIDKSVNEEMRARQKPHKHTKTHKQNSPSRISYRHSRFSRHSRNTEKCTGFLFRQFWSAIPQTNVWCGRRCHLRKSNDVTDPFRYWRIDIVCQWMWCVARNMKL